MLSVKRLFRPADDADRATWGVYDKLFHVICLYASLPITCIPFLILTLVGVLFKGSPYKKQFDYFSDRVMWFFTIVTAIIVLPVWLLCCLVAAFYRPKLTAGEKWLVAFTLICLAFWLSDFYLCAIKMFPVVVAAPPFAVLTALVAVGLGGFAWRTVAFVRTRTVACAHEQEKKHFVLSLLAAIFWTALAVILLVGTYENIYYSMKVRSFDDLLEVAPINAALVTPTVTAVYFILLTILRMKNRRNGEMGDQIRE